jgi:rSAM/selenodomain-associated transferase 1
MAQATPIDAATADAALIVLAKEPVPGRAKTRLCPPCTPAQAAGLAAAALADTLAAALAAPAARRVLALEGRRGDWVPGGFEVIAQRGAGLDERIAHAFEDVGGPALLVGMDTPQVSPGELASALGELARAETDAVLGPARDGGYWAVGMRDPRPQAFIGVPMSEPGTCRAQRARLAELGLSVVELPELRDVDRMEDAIAVAAQSSGGRFARAVAALG